MQYFVVNVSVDTRCTREYHLDTAKKRLKQRDGMEHYIVKGGNSLSG